MIVRSAHSAARANYWALKYLITKLRNNCSQLSACRVSSCAGELVDALNQQRYGIILFAARDLKPCIFVLLCGYRTRFYSFCLQIAFAPQHARTRYAFGRSKLFARTCGVHPLGCGQTRSASKHPERMPLTSKVAKTPQSKLIDRMREAMLRRSRRRRSRNTHSNIESTLHQKLPRLRTAS